MVNVKGEGEIDELGDLLERIDLMIERARCFARSRLASTAVGDRGY
jgi:hypothetical protein